MKKSENLECIAKAMSKMQAEMKVASKTKKSYNYKFADLAGVWEVLQEPLTSNGLTVCQDTFNTPEGPAVSTLVMHESGQWLEFGPLSIPMGKKDAHSTGSGITYAKRYQLCAALGVFTCDEDDDGNKAHKSAPKEEVEEPKIPQVNTQEWINVKSEIHGKSLIEEYLLAWSTHQNCSIVHVVNMCAFDDNRFQKRIAKFLEKKAKSEVEKKEEVNNNDE